MVCWIIVPQAMEIRPPRSKFIDIGCGYLSDRMNL